MTLTYLLEWTGLLIPGSPDASRSPEELEHRTGRRLPPPVSTLLLVLASQGQVSRLGETVGDLPLVRLLEALDRLRPLVPTAEPAPDRARLPWLDIDSASLLLLAGVVRRLGWDDLRRDPLLRPWGGPRFLQVLLAGIGTAVLGGRATEAEDLEPAAVLFAGMEREPNLPGLRHALDSVDADGRRRICQRLLPSPIDDATALAVDWTTLLDALAARLIGEFAARVRGFREAPRPAVVRQFLRTPGRVQVGKDVVSVLLAPSPYHVALHISGMDDPLSSVSWMGGRRLEFHLLGL